MITWMQKHRKYMLITMWVAVITFIGAGAVDWGGASYGSKATSVAKVGDIEISQTEFQKQYSLMYRQFNEMLGGKLNEALAKQIGVEQQAFNALINKALLLNLAQSYDFVISDEEVASEIQKMESFVKDGSFNKEIYKKLLQSNGYSIKEFEEALKKDLTIARLSKYLSSKPLDEERQALYTIAAISDKIEYKILDSNALSVTVDEKELQAFWELEKENYKTPAMLTVEKITTKPLKENHSAEDIAAYYTQNSFHFTNEQGELLTQEAALPQIIAALNDKATKLAANRLYIAWKKGELPTDVALETETFSAENAPYTQEIMSQLLETTAGDAPLKAVKVADDYVVFKLVKRVDPMVKTFAQARADVLPRYTAQQKRLKLQNLVETQKASFKGKTTPFITQNDTDAFAELSQDEAAQALKQLFTVTQPQGEIVISDQKVMLYNIKEQKLLFKENTKNTDLTLEQTMMQLKEQARLVALMEQLKKTHTIENYIK